MDHIQANTGFQGHFVQGTINTLTLSIFEIDGTPTDAESITFSIVNANDDVEALGGCPEKIMLGSYFLEWRVPKDQTPGKYIITWAYHVDNVEFIEIQSIVVSDSCGDPVLYSDMLILMRQSLELMINCAQAVPVYFRQARPSRDRQTFAWTKPLWNPSVGTTIYRNKNIVTDGLEIDYNRGQVTFDMPLTQYDTVHADYNFRWFTTQHLDRFLSNAIHSVNIYPAQTNYSLITLPPKLITPVLYGAAKDALRNLMMCLQFEEPIQFFGGHEEASKRFGQMETLKQNYEKDFENLMEQKKYGPYVGLTRLVVVPEFTLPGGRSRWFRYLFKTGSSG